MNDVRGVQEDLKEKLFKFLLPIQTERYVDHRVFEAVLALANNAAQILRSDELVPKALLNDLHTASKVLRAEAPHIKPETDAMIKMAEMLEFVFDLILLGESKDDRIPGVPRII